MTTEERLHRKDLERELDRERKNILAKMTDNDAQRYYNRYYKKDPYPEIDSALLNSADIYKYVVKTGMIFPFYPQELSGATYEVAIGEKVVWWDEEKQERHEEDLSRPGSYFKLEPNSIAFVTLEPMFRIPDYIALRFNLKIVHVYKGLLLGTGPIVDPGFVGKLSIPLHNLTANTYTFRRGDLLIAMEFTKLSSNKEWNGKLPKGKKLPEGNDLNKRKWIPEGRTVDDYINRSSEGNVMVRSSIPDNLREIRDIEEKTQKDFIETKKDVEQSIRSIQLVTILSIIPVLVFACTAIYQLGSANTVKSERIKDLEIQCGELEKENELFRVAFKKLNIDLYGLEAELDNKNNGQENEDAETD